MLDKPREVLLEIALIWFLCAAARESGENEKIDAISVERGFHESLLLPLSLLVLERLRRA
jgi:hypothetical protein